MGDDGIGVLIGQELTRYALPAEIKVFDGNIDMLGLLNEITKYNELIIIDSMKSTVASGEIIIDDIDVDKLVEETCNMPISSLHDIDIMLVLKLGYILFPERMPRKITLVGIGIKDIKPGIELSGEVKRSLAQAIWLVTHLLKRK